MNTSRVKELSTDDFSDNINRNSGKNKQTKQKTGTVELKFLKHGCPRSQNTITLNVITAGLLRELDRTLKQPTVEM